MGLYTDIIPDDVRANAARQRAKQEAWDDYVRDYTGCVDDDPGDARQRYFAAIEALSARDGGV